MKSFWESDEDYAARGRRANAAFRRGCVLCKSKLAWLHLTGAGLPRPKAVCINDNQCKRRQRAALTKGSGQ